MGDQSSSLESGAKEPHALETLPEPRSKVVPSDEGPLIEPGQWEAFRAGGSGESANEALAPVAHEEHAPSTRGRRLLVMLKRKRALIATGALVLGGVISLVIAIGFVMARSAPAWWIDVDKTSARNIELSKMVQNGTLTHITADRGTLIGGSVEWPVMMTDEAANAWLNIGLPDWFSKITDGMAWPESVTQIQIVFDNGIIRIGVRATTESGSRIYSCAIRPELRADGSLWMRANTVSMGKLTLPASWVLRGADAHAAEYIPEQLRGTAQAEALFEKLTGRLPLFEQAEVDLSDGRIVRLTDLRVRDGTVIALCVTEIPE